MRHLRSCRFGTPPEQPQQRSVNMGIFSFFSSSKPAGQQTRRKPSRKLELESLEDRCVPATLALAPVTLTSVDGQTGGSGATQQFAQFNPNLGTLESVTITQAGSITTNIQVENVSTTSTANIQVSITGSMTLSGAGVSDNLTLPTNQPFVFNAS